MRTTRWLFEVGSERLEDEKHKKENNVDKAFLKVRIVIIADVPDFPYASLFASNVKPVRGVCIPLMNKSEKLRNLPRYIDNK